MSNADHYALLVTIDDYPGLSNLQGPENDGKRFVDWLSSTRGGNLPAANIKHISSSDYTQVTNPDDANPTEMALKRELNDWLLDGQDWVTRHGARLYLFFAGHGFTAGSSLSNPALFTATARNFDTSHIAAYQYASRIVNAGFYDEVILIMDCCQDVLKASAVIDPTWSPDDNGASANVKFLQAYGAPRGSKSFEEPMGANGTVHGMFTSTFLDALQAADADAYGDVYGRAVKDRFHELWGQRYLSKTNYSPPIRLPDANDIVLYRRGAAGANGTVQADVDTDNDEWTPGSEFRIGVPPVVPSISVSRARVPKAPSVPGAGPGGVSVKLQSQDAGFDIVLLDNLSMKIARGTGALDVTLEPGNYTALVRSPGASSSAMLKVGRKPLEVALEGPKFRSAAPLPDTSSTHEYHLEPALRYSVKPSGPLDPTSGGLFLFVRDSIALGTREPFKTPPLTLAGLERRYSNDLGSAWQIDPDNLFAHASLTLRETTYSLILATEHEQESAIVIPIVRGWRTDVYLDMATNAAGYRVPDLESAVFIFAQPGAPTPLLAEETRAAEVARLRFSDGQPVHLPAETVSPMHALFAAYAAATAQPPDQPLIRTALGRIPPEIRAALPDALLLEAFSYFCTPDRGEIAFGKRPLIPLVGAGWTVAQKLIFGNYLKVAGEIPLEIVGQWRLAGSVWTHWCSDRKVAREMRERLLNDPGKPPALKPNVNMEPRWSLDAWKAVAPGMSEPFSDHSPFQQALRRRILDLIEEDSQRGEPTVAASPGKTTGGTDVARGRPRPSGSTERHDENPVFRLASAFGLPNRIAIPAYNALYASAVKPENTNGPAMSPSF